MCKQKWKGLSTKRNGVVPNPKYHLWLLICEEYLNNLYRRSGKGGEHQEIHQAGADRETSRKEKIKTKPSLQCGKTVGEDRDRTENSDGEESWHEGYEENWGSLDPLLQKSLSSVLSDFLLQGLVFKGALLFLKVFEVLGLHYPLFIMDFENSLSAKWAVPSSLNRNSCTLPHFVRHR